MTGSMAAFSTIAVVTAPAKAAQFQFQCGTQLTSADPGVKRMQQMWATIERESGGRIHTQVFANSQLGTEDAMFAQLRLGALAFQFVSPGTLTAVIPAFNIHYVGFVFKDSSEGAHAFEGPLGGWIRQEATNKGIHELRTIWNVEMGQIGTANRPIRNPEDLHGMKIRTAGNKVSLDFFKALGASPTPVASVEVYPSMQTKLLDGVSMSVGIMASFRVTELIKYVSLTNHVWNTEMLISNGDVWKSLPPDLQEVVERNNTRYAALASRDVSAADVALQAKLAAAGIAFNPVDQAPFRQLLRGYYAEWAPLFGPGWGMLQSSLGRKLI